MSKEPLHYVLIMIHYIFYYSCDPAQVYQLAIIITNLYNFNMNTQFVQVNKYLKYLHNNEKSIAIPRNNEDIFIFIFFYETKPNA